MGTSEPWFFPLCKHRSPPHGARLRVSSCSEREAEQEFTRPGVPIHEGNWNSLAVPSAGRPSIPTRAHGASSSAPGDQGCWPWAARMGGACCCM